MFGFGKTFFKNYPARLVQPPSSENPNLHLQQGVFTVVVDDRVIDNNTVYTHLGLNEQLKLFQEEHSQKVSSFLQPDRCLL